VETSFTLLPSLTVVDEHAAVDHELKRAVGQRRAALRPVDCDGHGRLGGVGHPAESSHAKMQLKARHSAPSAHLTGAGS